MAHVHGALYRERGFLTSEGENINNAQEVLALLQASGFLKMWPSFTAGVTKKGTIPR
jgi:hypothetical protein